MREPGARHCYIGPEGLVILEQILHYINNWFVCDIHKGVFSLDGAHNFSPPFESSARFFRIVGSAQNDGVISGDETPVAETFEGEIWELAIPPAILQIVGDVSAWQERYGESALSPFTSESFGGYSYSKAAAQTSSASGGGADWLQTFAARLRPWRKI